METQNKTRTMLAYIGVGLALVALGPFLAWGLSSLLDSETHPLQSSIFYTFLISTWTLEATITIALFVFRLQSAHEKQNQTAREQAAAELILSGLEIAFEYLLLVPHGAGLPGAAIPLKEGFAAYAGELQRILSKKSMRQLIMVISAAQDPSLSDDEIGFDGMLAPVARPFVRAELLPVASTSYSRLLGNIADWREALDEPTYKLIFELSQRSGIVMKPYDKDRVVFTGRHEKNVIEYDPATTYYRLYDGAVLLCDGRIDPDAYSSLSPVSEGFVRTERYIGFISNGKREGEGTSFSRDDHAVLAAGEWKDDKLISGIEYDWIVAIPGDVNLNVLNSDIMTADYSIAECQQLHEEHILLLDIEDIARDVAIECLPLKTDEFEATLKALDILYVADIKVSNGMCEIFNVRPLDEVIDVSKTRKSLEEMMED